MPSRSPSATTEPTEAPPSESAEPSVDAEPSATLIGGWRQVTGESVPYLHDLTRDPAGYFGVGLSSASSDAEPIPAIWRSPDGDDWTEEPYEFAGAPGTDVADALSTVVSTPTGYAALGTSAYGIAMSADASVWTYASLEVGACPAALAARDDTVVAVGAIGPCGMGGLGVPATWSLTSDGTWTPGQLHDNGGGWLHGVVATADGFLAWGTIPAAADDWTCQIGCFVHPTDDPYAGAPWYSTDGATWERLEDPAFAGAIVEGIATTDASTVALGWLPSTGAPETYRLAVWTTEDGAAWSPVDGPLPFGDVGQGMGIGIGGGGSALAVWVMADPSATSRIWTSGDGVAWHGGAELPIGSPSGVSPLGDGLMAYGSVQEADAGAEVPCTKVQVLAGVCRTVGSAWVSSTPLEAD